MESNDLARRLPCARKWIPPEMETRLLVVLFAAISENKNLLYNTTHSVLESEHTTMDKLSEQLDDFESPISILPTEMIMNASDCLLYV